MGSGTNKATKKDVSKFQDVLAPIVFLWYGGNVRHWVKREGIPVLPCTYIYIYTYIHKPILS